MALAPWDSLAQPCAAERARCAAVVCVLQEIDILKRSKVDPHLAHRGSARFNYSVQQGWVQTAVTSEREHGYSCVPVPAKKAKHELGVRGMDTPLRYPLSFFCHLSCCSKLGS